MKMYGHGVWSFYIVNFSQRTFEKLPWVARPASRCTLVFPPRARAWRCQGPPTNTYCLRALMHWKTCPDWLSAKPYAGDLQNVCVHWQTLKRDFQKRPTYIQTKWIKRDGNRSNETNIRDRILSPCLEASPKCQKRPTKETYTHGNRPVFIKRDVYRSTETYTRDLMTPSKLRRVRAEARHTTSQRSLCICMGFPSFISISRDVPKGG